MIEWKVRVADPALLLAAQWLCGGFVGAGVVDRLGPDVAPPCPAGWRTTVGAAAGCAAGFGDVCTMNAGGAVLAPKAAAFEGPPVAAVVCGSVLLSGRASGAAVSCTESGVVEAGIADDAFAGAALLWPGVATLADGWSPNTTRAFAGRRRTAVAQSVGAGWRSGGTPSIQMRHMPAGGLKPAGTVDDPAALWAPAGLAINALMVKTLTTNL